MMISAKEVFNNIKSLPHSKWPNRKKPNRLEPECWPIICPKFKFVPGTMVFSMGSCFARNIEEYLSLKGFIIPTLGFSVPKTEWHGGRPNGILNKYTPPSVYNELAWASHIIKRGSLTDNDIMPLLIQIDDDAWIDLQMAGFLPVSLKRALERRREVFNIYRTGLDAAAVTITLGLIECWWDAELKTYIQQVPSMDMVSRYPNRFYFDMLNYEKSLDYVKRSIEIINLIGSPNKKILVTTSPVPLARSFFGQDIITANMYGKSVLRAVAGAIAHEYANVDYFPSYESVMLSRYAKQIWNDDLIHIRDGFVGKIVEHLVRNYIAVDNDEESQQSIDG